MWFPPSFTATLHVMSTVGTSTPGDRSSLIVCGWTRIVHLNRWRKFTFHGGLSLIWFVNHFNTKYFHLLQAFITNTILHITSFEICSNNLGWKSPRRQEFLSGYEGASGIHRWSGNLSLHLRPGLCFALSDWDFFFSIHPCTELCFTLSH